MRYYEGIDYWVRHVEFPNMASESVVASHGDGTYTIYINTLFCEERQRDRLNHELQHLIDEHFYRDDLSITAIERQADGGAIHMDIRTLPGTPPQFSVFRSEELPDGISFGFYIPDASMKPILKKGQLVYCDSRQMENGDFGLFQYRGNTMLRQYCKDMLGMTYLFTLNRKRRIDDLLICPADERDLICLGRVITKEKYPLPDF